MIDVSTERAKIKERIEYGQLLSEYDSGQLDEIVELLLEVSLMRAPTIHIGRSVEYPLPYVQDRFEALGRIHIEKVLDGVNANCTDVRNPKAYLLKTLLNATSTTENHYTMLVNHDMYS